MAFDPLNLVAEKCYRCGSNLPRGAALCPNCRARRQQGASSPLALPLLTAAEVAPSISTATSSGERSPLFAVPVHKFVLVSLCTFGIYQYYWLYVTWVRLKQRDRLGVSPLWRTVFSGIWNFELFPLLRRTAEAEGKTVAWSGAALAFLHLVLGVAWRLPEPWSWLGLFAMAPLVPIVATVAALPSSRGHLEGYSRWDVVAITLGAPLLALAVYLALFTPAWLSL